MCVAGSEDSGADFEAAVKKISDSGNQQDLQTLKDAGVDVDAALKGAGAGDNNAGNKDGQGAQGAQGAQGGQNKAQGNQAGAKTAQGGAKGQD